MNPEDREDVMLNWDMWREYIANGGDASWPRDAFESLLDYYDEKIKELENNMKSCATCSYWRKIRDEDYNAVDSSVKNLWPGPHGECRLINEYSTEIGAWLANSLIYISDDTAKNDSGWNVESDVGLITRPTFWCGKWKLLLA